MLTQELQYWDKNLRLRGFLAREVAMAAPRPGVLVVHEGLGLNAHIIEQTQRVRSALSFLQDYRENIQDDLWPLA